MAERIDAGLNGRERELLAQGLSQWGAPATPTDDVARAIGFADAKELVADGSRLAGDLGAGGNLSRRDWTRALVATEFVFASDVYGAGVEWEIVTGEGDEETLKALRAVQRKLVGIARPRS